MPVLPLPTGDTSIHAGAIPVTSEADVLKHLPIEYRKDEIAVVRDALVSALTAAAILYQNRSAYAVAHADVATAADRYLVALAKDRGFYKQRLEKDEDFRARILAIPDLVTPDAILALVNAILAPWTSAKAQYLESIQDRMYVRFAGVNGDAAVVGASPLYGTRLYPEDAAINGGKARPQSSPGAAWAFGDHVGRYFILRVPDLSPLDDAIPIAYASGSPVGALGRIFVGDGSAPPSLGYVYQNTATALDVYRAISDGVEAIRGHSIRWMLISDASLT